MSGHTAVMFYIVALKTAEIFFPNLPQKLKAFYSQFNATGFY